MHVKATTANAVAIATSVLIVVLGLLIEDLGVVIVAAVLGSCNVIILVFLRRSRKEL